jgi:bifunctional DNA-binding transcriptional regulator/antitoxin component of YhaV-PrlF toxin-antitoxin module
MGSEPGTPGGDDRKGGIVKVQKSSKGRYSVTLPKEWAEERGIEPGERLYVGDPSDGSTTGILEPFRRLFR